MNANYDALRRFAADIRIETLKMMAAFGSGHVGGCMSIADVLAVLYGKRMKYHNTDPDWDGRDRLVLSKGHCGPALYAALALSGFFPVDWLNTLNQPGTRLPSHCDHLKTPGIDASTGSLGQGISIACGMALAAKLKNNDNKIYAILGDGELQEGQVWEAFLFASQQKLSDLIIFIDRNRMQLDGATESISALDPLKEKLVAFGLAVSEVDGHDVEAIDTAISEILEKKEKKPHTIILNTKKGGGYNLAEQATLCHHMSVTFENAQDGIREILRRLDKGLPVCGVQYDR